MPHYSPNCNRLVEMAKDQDGLSRKSLDPELWQFTRTWIERFRTTHEDNYAEKFIYLWVTINAWASMAVPDITRNHEDAYLVHSMAADKKFKERFKKYISEDNCFLKKVEDLISLAPVF
ncbi:MAG: hypothetical protein ACE5IC_03565 [Candidatus Brocadiales bacterium]